MPVLLAGLVLTTSCSVFHASVTQEYRETLAAGPYDALIVPGFPFKNGQWSRVTKARVYWSRELFQKGVAHHIIYSGAAVHTPYVEGELMALYARAIGVPPHVILTETNALHSCENLYYSYQLARRLGFEKVAVVSDPIHTPHLRRVAREFDLPLAFLPVDFVRLIQIPKSNPQVDSRAVYVEGFVPPKQRLTRQEIKWASSGGRIRAEQAHPNNADDGAKFP
jgi:uncharacterized SAM-binding protein YcdF (DUF218 family)